MAVLIWATLLLCVGSSADTGVRRNFCQGSFCVNLNVGVITAEAGLCAVIPCSFTTNPSFSPQSVVWYKCEPSKPRCGDSDVIYSRNRRKIQYSFTGRVLLLEPDVTQENCSIIINDMTASDSGSYQLRVNGAWSDGTKDGFQYETRANVFVKALTHRPTVEVPPLTGGQQSTLSCTAPGLCSGSVPLITWMLSGAGENNSYITGSITEFTENLTAFAQRHSSTWSFTPSAKHHGANVTCKVSFIDGTATEETVTLSVTLSPRILNRSSCEVKAEVLTCLCVSEGFPLPTIKWPLIKSGTKYLVSNGVSGNTVWTNITLAVKDRSYTTVVCVSSNDVGEATKNLTVITQNGIKNSSHPEGPPTCILTHLQKTEVIFRILICVILTGTICFLGKKCLREKHNSSGNVENLEMMTTPFASQMDASPAMEYENCDQGGATGGAPPGSIKPEETDYSEI